MKIITYGTDENEEILRLRLMKMADGVDIIAVNEKNEQLPFGRILRINAKIGLQTDILDGRIKIVE